MPDEGHYEDGRHRGREVGGDGLDVQEQLGVLEAQDDRDPQDADANQDDHSAPDIKQNKDVKGNSTYIMKAAAEAAAVAEITSQQQRQQQW